MTSFQKYSTNYVERKQELIKETELNVREGNRKMEGRNVLTNTSFNLQPVQAKEEEVNKAYLPTSCDTNRSTN